MSRTIVKISEFNNGIIVFHVFAYIWHMGCVAVWAVWRCFVNIGLCAPCAVNCFRVYMRFVMFYCRGCAVVKGVCDAALLFTFGMERTRRKKRVNFVCTGQQTAFDLVHFEWILVCVDVCLCQFRWFCERASIGEFEMKENHHKLYDFKKKKKKKRVSDDVRTKKARIATYGW